MTKLPPLEKVDPTGMELGISETTELKFHKCKHKLYALSASEARCYNCSVGYKGPNILALVKSSQD